MKTPTLCLLAVLAASAFGANILPNPSFEYWLDTLGVRMPLGWLTSEVLFPNTALKDTQSHTGAYCLKLVGGDTSAFASTATVVRPGYSYEFTAWASVTALLGGSFVMQWLKLLGGAVGTPVLIPVYRSSGYRSYSNWVTAPESAALLSVSFATLPNVSVYLDDVTLDDTTLGAVTEERPARPASLHSPRKVIACSGTRAAWPAEVLFDPLGRRVRGAGHLRSGVYFIPPDNRPPLR